MSLFDPAYDSGTLVMASIPHKVQPYQSSDCDKINANPQQPFSEQKAPLLVISAIGPLTGP